MERVKIKSSSFTVPPFGPPTLTQRPHYHHLRLRIPPAPSCFNRAYTSRPRMHHDARCAGSLIHGHARDVPHRVDQESGARRRR
ncbi:hypothetical protein SCP_0905660 [Sparassis crispa]|uniref:Uncharacterized protein n=1 Tax=Sparassis crispa TaxID=139825 RepID=A0A401GWS8_9APHY|nr:hypothetical protein SCP_0905660 [Sparassis crispa]GBE86686.1 hypothetical protein SCP_0905660 [Sparassis crispa]